MHHRLVYETTVQPYFANYTLTSFKSNISRSCDSFEPCIKKDTNIQNMKFFDFIIKYWPWVYLGFGKLFVSRWINELLYLVNGFWFWEAVLSMEIDVSFMGDWGPFCSWKNQVVGILSGWKKCTEISGFSILIICCNNNNNSNVSLKFYSTAIAYASIYDRIYQIYIV